MISEKDLKKAEDVLKKFHLEWKKKKRGCMDAIANIAESMDMNPKDFAKKVCIETDEEMKVVCPV